MIVNYCKRDQPRIGYLRLIGRSPVMAHCDLQQIDRCISAINCNILNHYPCIVIHIILTDSWQYAASLPVCIENLADFIKIISSAINLPNNVLLLTLNVSSYKYSVTFYLKNMRYTENPPKWTLSCKTILVLPITFI